MFLAMRVDPEEEGLVSRYLWSHEDADVGGAEGDRHIYVNRDSGNENTALAAADRGRLSVFEDTTGTGNGNNTQPASGSDTGGGPGPFDYGLDDGVTPTYGNALDNTSGVVFLTYLCDGNYQSGTFDASTTHSSSTASTSCGRRGASPWSSSC